MKDFVAKGDKITITAGSDTASGAMVVLEDIARPAEGAAKSGEDLVILVEGIVRLPKAAEAIAAGQKVYWNASNGNVQKTASSHKGVGVMAKAYASGASHGEVKLAIF